ncbi:SCO family protein [Luteimonas notoginsengisoli]|uniref:SCO family protein n=1 Tax=Luteimonas notoginsengisoli TaxID=1578200 RepID=A0ABV7UU05_9GAMM
MTYRHHIAALAAALLALSALLFAHGAPAAEAGKLKAGVFDPPRAAPELALLSSNGGDLSLAAYRGKVVLLGFGFTTCPKVCPTTLAVLAAARKRLGEQGRQVQVVYVTVDPERDSAQRMRSYLAAFDPGFVGGTGTAAQLAAARARYGVTAERKVVGDSYFYAHSSSVYLIDTKGLLRGMMPYGRAPEDYAHDVRVLLAE